MSVENKVIIKGENKIGSAVNSAKKDLTGFGQVAEELGKKLKTALSVTAVTASLHKLGSTCTACFNEFHEAGRSYKQLATALGDTKGYEKVVSVIDKLSTQTLTSKDGIEAMASQLAGLGKSASEIESISSAAVYLSNVTGKDLNSSMTTLLNTYNGTTTQLNRLGIDTSNLTKEQLANGAAVDLVIDKFQALSEEMANDSAAQQIVNIKNTIGDIRQAIGGVVDYIVGPALANINKSLNSIYGKIKEVVVYVGAVIKNFPEVFKRTMILVGDMIRTVFSWDFISDTVTATFDSIIAVIKGVFDLIPKLVPDTLSFITTEVTALILDLAAFALKTVEEFINRTVNALANTKFGEVLGLNSISVNLGSNAVGVTADKYQEQANGYVQNIANNFDDIKDIVSETASNALQPVTDFLDDKFGGLISGYADSIDAIVTPTVNELTDAVEVTNQSIEDGNKEQKDGLDAITSGNFLDNISTKLGNWIKDKTGGSSEQASSAAGKVISYATDAMGEAGSVVSELATNMATMGPLIGSIVTALKYVLEGFGEVFGDTLNEFIQYILEPLREIGRVVGNLIIPILNAIMPIIAQLSDLLMKVFDSVGAAVMPLINIIVSLITPSLEMLTKILDLLMPVFKVFAKGVVTITGTLEYVVQVLRHWVATIMNWLAGLDIMGWKPFEGLAMSDPGAPGNFGSFIQSKWSSIDQAFENGGNATTSTTSTTAAVTNASYSGATTIHLNVYQQGVVCGDGGIMQFAQMIREELDVLDHYGR